MTTKKVAASYSPEVRERAVRLVLKGGGDHPAQWSAINSVSAKIGCTSETLRKWVRQAERDGGQRPGPRSADRERIKALERGNRELRQANEIRRKARAYFAMAELDRRSRT
jgi:transposase